jgi:hypothetical protein
MGGRHCRDRTGSTTDVAIGRVFVQGGKGVKREDFTTHYTPRDKVTCTPKKTASVAAADQPDASGPDNT